MITQIGGASDFTLISVYNGYKNAEDPSEAMEVVITNLIDNLTDFPASDVKYFEPSDFKGLNRYDYNHYEKFIKGLEYVKGNTKGYSNRIIYVVEKYRTLIKNLMNPVFMI